MLNCTAVLFRVDESATSWVQIESIRIQNSVQCTGPYIISLFLYSLCISKNFLILFGKFSLYPFSFQMTDIKKSLHTVDSACDEVNPLKMFAFSSAPDG